MRERDGFVRNGNERERERERERKRERGGGVGSRETSCENENGLAERSTLNQRHRCADLRIPSSWRLTSTRTHTLPSHTTNND